jgi:RNA polymerase sigma-70 factor (ECF subfamily)
MALWPRRPSIEVLVFEHYQDLYRFAYRLTGVAADAEDLTQETFYRAQEALSRLRHPRRAKAWLFRILRNLYLQDRRQESARSYLPWTAVEEEFSLPAEAVTRSLQEERLQAALLQIEEIYRTPVILFYFGSFSYQEIAELLDLPPGTVMSRLARGKTALRRLLSGQGMESSSDPLPSLEALDPPRPKSPKPPEDRPED